VAGQKSKRRSRKRRTPGASAGALTAPRRARSAEAEVAAAPRQRPTRPPAGAVGERPPSPFGGLPISELAIFAGGIGALVGVVQGGGPALIVGVLVCTLGVVEVTAREHFSGYRSHASLLAGIPAVGAGIVVIVLAGVPRQRGLVLLAVIPVYAALFWLLRKRFMSARQARLARPPAP
jgi:hypothetical protein